MSNSKGFGRENLVKQARNRTIARQFKTVLRHMGRTYENEAQLRNFHERPRDSELYDLKVDGFRRSPANPNRPGNGEYTEVNPNDERTFVELRPNRSRLEVDKPQALMGMVDQAFKGLPLGTTVEVRFEVKP